MKCFIRSKTGVLKDFAVLAYEYNVGLEIALSFEDIKYGVDLSSYAEFEVTIHAPFFDINIASHNPFVRRKSVDILKDTLSLCNEIKPKNIVIHHNYMPFLYNFDEEYYSASFVAHFEKILEMRKSDYFISLENVFETNYSIGRKIVDKLGTDFVGFCFDCGHFNLFTEITLEEWISKWKDNIIEMHIHNNYGFRDDHNSLMQGIIDIKSILYLHKPMFLTIENRTVEDTRSSLEFLRDIGCL
jgi:sugar phosphate isomerase/epimerase